MGRRNEGKQKMRETEAVQRRVQRRVRLWLLLEVTLDLYGGFCCGPFTLRAPMWVKSIILCDVGSILSHLHFPGEETETQRGRIQGYTAGRKQSQM